MATWEDTLLAELGAPASALNRQKLDLWESAEGGLQPEHANNPFNTSLDSSMYPHVPTTDIPIYPSLAIGLSETARTLLHSSPSYGYDAIVQNLRSGGSEQAFAQALIGSSWAGSHYQGSTAIQSAAGGGSPNVAAVAGDAATMQNAGLVSSVLNPGNIVTGSVKELGIRLFELVLGLLLLWIGAQGLVRGLAGGAGGLVRAGAGI